MEGYTKQKIWAWEIKPSNKPDSTCCGIAFANDEDGVIKLIEENGFEISDLHSIWELDNTNKLSQIGEYYDR